MWGRGISHEVLAEEACGFGFCFGYAVLVGGKGRSREPDAAYGRLPGPEEPVQQARSLEQTIKYLEELHNLKTTRDRYLKTIGNLDAFEIDLKKETDDADGNYYQGCSLTIEDDKGKKFSTKNPLIIWTVAQEVTHICEGKLAEVEAKLVIK